VFLPSCWYLRVTRDVMGKQTNIEATIIRVLLQAVSQSYSATFSTCTRTLSNVYLLRHRYSCHVLLQATHFHCEHARPHISFKIPDMILAAYWSKALSQPTTIQTFRYHLNTVRASQLYCVLLILHDHQPAELLLSTGFTRMEMRTLQHSRRCSNAGALLT
jgi:hypothetical protein